jgi:cytochrome P450
VRPAREALRPCGGPRRAALEARQRAKLLLRRPCTSCASRRDPNPHLGYDGGGVHFCLGANLARREITVVSDEPAGLLFAFVHGIKRLPVAWTPPR